MNPAPHVIVRFMSPNRRCVLWPTPECKPGNSALPANMQWTEAATKARKVDYLCGRAVFYFSLRKRIRSCLAKFQAAGP